MKKRLALSVAVSAIAVVAAGCSKEEGAAGGGSSAGAGRDYVWAAGSSTVFPYATRVAENFARKTSRSAPKVESLGTGGGIKLFCGGVGQAFPDVANASRPMKQSEFDACAKNGVTDIMEVKIGFDGIVVASDKASPDYVLKIEHLHQALSQSVLKGGAWVANPAKTWKDVDASLPAQRILVYGPPPSSGTRDAFLELGIEAGARKNPEIAAIRTADEAKFKEMVNPLRTDGAWIDSGENDNAIVGTLTKTPGSIGVFGYSFLEQNADKVKAATIDGVSPTLATISDGSYPLSRSIYIYVKKSQMAVVPGLKDFVTEFTSDVATGRGGYLQERGLVPLPADQHKAQAAAALQGVVMARPAK